MTDVAVTKQPRFPWRAFFGGKNHKAKAAATIPMLSWIPMTYYVLSGHGIDADTNIGKFIVAAITGVVVITVAITWIVATRRPEKQNAYGIGIGLAVITTVLLGGLARGFTVADFDALEFVTVVAAFLGGGAMHYFSVRRAPAFER